MERPEALILLTFFKKSFKKRLTMGEIFDILSKLARESPAETAGRAREEQAEP